MSKGTRIMGLDDRCQACSLSLRLGEWKDLDGFAAKRMLLNRTQAVRELLKLSINAKRCPKCMFAMPALAWEQFRESNKPHCPYCKFNLVSVDGL